MPKKLWLGLIPLAGLFWYQFYQFNVLQDDAFISFRYIRNFLEGHGLVFNIGERVEGYTNFLWIILLSLLSKLGLPLIETSRALGLAAGAGTIALSAYAAHTFYPKRDGLRILSVPLLLAANGAFAYWAGSGLETGLFTLLAAASTITYLTNAPLSLLFVTLATLTRPEGALLAFLFGVAGIVLKQKNRKATFIYWAALAVLLLPYAVFKWFYFGSLLPNPFYAKTGFSMEYWQSGLEYAGLFFQYYGLYGLALLLPLIFWRKLTLFSRFCLIVFCGYTLYVVSVGGDVLKAHRFFVPALFLFYFPMLELLTTFLQRSPLGRPAFAFVFLLSGVLFYRLPRPYLIASAGAERSLVERMKATGNYFNRFFVEKTAATSTIGALSYYGEKLRVLDMLGLTDPAVAKNPEKVDGIESTWKERHFNTAHVLSKKPEVILFSTGIKPSAPAERALFLYADFRRNYRLEFFYWEHSFNMFYRRFQDRPVESRPDLPARAVNRFNEGVNFIAAGNFAAAVARLRETLEDGADDCAAVHISLAYAYFSAGYPDSTEHYLLTGMELDGGGPVGRYYYRNFLRSQMRLDEANVQDSILVKSIPNAAEFLARQKPFDNP